MPQWWNVLSREDLRERARCVLEQYCPDRLKAPGPTPITAIAENLQDEGRLKVNLASTLGVTEDGRKLIGQFILKPPEIRLDPAAHNHQGRFAFTLAHELGHFFLHSFLNIPPSYSGGFKDVEQSLGVDDKSAEPDSGLAWVEWQANRFAAELLMPCAPFLMELIRIQRQMDLTNNLGLVLVENQAYSLNDFETQVSKLAFRFQVSKEAVTYRLDNLGRLKDRRDKGWRSLGSAFSLTASG